MANRENFKVKKEMLAAGGGGPKTFKDLHDTPNDYSGEAGKYPIVKATEDGLEFDSSSKTFTGLTDTPADYSSHSGQYVIVNGAENALEYDTTSKTFEGLTDTPNDYSGKAGQYPIVNGTEDGLIYDTTSKTFIGLNDTPSSYSGQAGRGVLVNDTEDGVEFDTVAGSGQSGIIPAWCFCTIIQGTWTLIVSAAQWGGLLYNSTEANGDEVCFNGWFQKGTYTFCHLGQLRNDGGYVETYLDSTLLDTWDMYNGTLVNNAKRTITPIVISSTGLKSMKLKLNGKNPSSGNYACRITATYFWRIS